MENLIRMLKKYFEKSNPWIQTFVLSCSLMGSFANVSQAYQRKQKTRFFFTFLHGMAKFVRKWTQQKAKVQKCLNVINAPSPPYQTYREKAFSHPWNCIKFPKSDSGAKLNFSKEFTLKLKQKFFKWRKKRQLMIVSRGSVVDSSAVELSRRDIFLDSLSLCKYTLNQVRWINCMLSLN